MEYTIQGDGIQVKSATQVRIVNHLSLATPQETLDIKVVITTDFEDIDPKYHEILLNMLTSKYLDKVSFGDNPFSACQPKPKTWIRKMINKYIG